MPSYEVFMHFDLLDLVPSRGLQRKQIMDFIRLLRDRPEARGDFTEKDHSFREYQVKIVGEHAITYRVDDAARTVMVVDVRLAGR